jgi:hypothetical protein
MKRNGKSYGLLGFLLLTAPFLFGGCDCNGKKTPTATDSGKTEQPRAAEKPIQPLIKKQEIADWCPEHGVPESICTRCNPTLVEGFKKKGDWCKEHDLPESQCLQCHPELKEKLEAMKPKSQG